MILQHVFASWWQLGGGGGNEGEVQSRNNCRSHVPGQVEGAGVGAREEGFALLIPFPHNFGHQAQAVAAEATRPQPPQGSATKLNTLCGNQGSQQALRWAVSAQARAASLRLSPPRQAPAPVPSWSHRREGGRVPLKRETEAARARWAPVLPPLSGPARDAGEAQAQSG